jgi:hypothetical protein
VTYDLGCDAKLLVPGFARITFSHDGSKASISGGEMGLRIICAAVAAILVGAFYLLASLSGSSVTILIAGGLLCLLPYYGLWKFLESEAYSDVDLYLPGVATVIGLMLGGMSRWIFGLAQPSVIDLLAVMLAVVSSGIVIATRLRGRRARCELCRHPLTHIYYQCLRCDRMICERPSCWLGEYHRCSDCEKYQVPLFQFDEEGWFERLGPRIESGRCLRCEKEGRECDLRRCGRCPWLMCTQCWDLENGRCIRCRWMMPDLSEFLR